MSDFIDEFNAAIAGMWHQYTAAPTHIYVPLTRYARNWRGRKFVYWDYPPWLIEYARKAE